MLLHVEALEPALDVAAGVVGAPLGLRAVPAEPLPVEAIVFLVVEQSLDGAVDEQIRVAPDRRGEMYVSLEREAEVADVVRRVHRLLERAEQHRLQQAEVGAAADLV